MFTTFLAAALFFQDPTVQIIDSKVHEVVEHALEIPGLNSDEFPYLREEIKNHWNELVSEGVLQVKASDRETRPIFVALQAVIEHVLSTELNQSLSSVTGVIHTPMPATPLCMKETVSPELIDPSLEKDPLRLFTVKARARTVRDFLYKGGRLYVVYPKNGFDKRTEIQRNVYLKELTLYPYHLFDRPLNCEEIDRDLIGAFYLLTNHKGKTFAFAIQMTQANDPQEIGTFGLWFGEVDHPAVKGRLDAVLDFIQSKGFPVLVAQ